MAKIKIVLDQRTKKANDLYPVKLSISHQRKTSLIYLGFDVRTDQFIVPDDKNKLSLPQISNHPEARFFNNTIKNQSIIANAVIVNKKLSGELDRLTLAELRNLIENGEQEPQQTEPQAYKLLDHFDYYIAISNKPRTQELYTGTKAKILKFVGYNPDFSEINLDWLRSFDKFMSRNNAINTRAIDMRNLRAVFNDAIKTGKINKDLYPFEHFSIKTEETQPRFLTVEQLRELRDFPVQDHQRKYRDMFMLTFYLIGINPIDLLHLKESNIENGRIKYTRAKTGQKFDVLIQPEAEEIINRYRGKEYLLNFKDEYTNYKDFTHRWNENLQQIGPMQWVWNKHKTKKNKKKITPLFPDLSIYWARHTWGTMALKINVNFTTISKSLGHKTGSKTTWVYAHFDQMESDKANRQVIDFLNGSYLPPVNQPQ